MPTYGVLINMKYIKYIDFHNSEIMLYNEYKIRISRSKKEEVKKQYAQFIAK